MKYGYFSHDNKEYVITRPDTPTPWINYLNNGKYCAMVSNTGGGYSFFIDPKDQRILRYRYNNLPIDRPGRYFYVRDNIQEIYWSPTWQPVGTSLDCYDCHHGLGYTQINSRFDDINASVLYFVPLDEDVEIWKLTLTNQSKRSKNISIFSYAEFCLWDAVKDQRDLQYIQNVAMAQFEPSINSIRFHLFAAENAPQAFFGINHQIDGFDCDREQFIGPYRSEQNPLAVEQGQSFNSQSRGGNPIASIHKKIDISPGEEFSIIAVLGIVPTHRSISSILAKYTQSQEVERALHRLESHWDNHLKNFQVKTDDPEFDLVVNVWNQYQCKTTFDWARYASYYETGIGRGIGFRDCFQDTLSVCHNFPTEVRQRILKLAQIQFEDGKVFHNYFPLTDSGAFPDYLNPNMPFFGDDHLWMIFGVFNYLKETGDLSILKVEVPFVEKSQASLYDHLKRAISFTQNHLGPHGFPLIGTADWNDTMQLHGPRKAGESIMVAMQYHKALLDMSEIALQIQENQDHTFFLDLAHQMRVHINTTAWDGQWYIRAYTDNGEVIGSHKNAEGQIFLNTQSWAVISGVASRDRGLICMDAVRTNLLTEYGIKLFHPPYSKFNNQLNGITTFPPGLKENAAIFCHTNPWAEIAECILGRADNAFDYYTRISPTTKNLIADIHQTEPYIFSQMITGNDHPAFGAAKNSWLTGTASWTLKAATDWILGIRAEFHGLIVDPCIPKHWNQVKINRLFRGCLYQICINNPSHVSRGILQIEVDSKKMESLAIPIFSDKKIHTVDVLLG